MRATVVLMALVLVVLACAAQGASVKSAASKVRAQPPVVVPQPGAPQDHARVQNQAPVETPPTVPNLIGATWGHAEAQVENVGMRMLTTAEPPVLGQDSGVVFMQSPPAGTPAKAGASVKVTLRSWAEKTDEAYLSQVDLDQRRGFDLDNGEYRPILSGADFLLRRHEYVVRQPNYPEPGISEDSSLHPCAMGELNCFYKTQMEFEALEGARFVSLASYKRVPDEDPSWDSLHEACAESLGHGPFGASVPAYDLNNHDNLYGACVLTASGRMAAVLAEPARSDSYPGVHGQRNDIDVYPFRFVLFYRTSHDVTRARDTGRGH